MDIFCRHCGEPWEHDTLHEFGDYNRRAKLFAKLGCNALMDDGETTTPCRMPVVDSEIAQASAVLQDDSPYPDDWLGAHDLVAMLDYLGEE